jgi:zinc-binding alcohol dehydrogenase family protein
MKSIGYVGGKPLNSPDAFIEFEQDIPEPVGRDILVRIEAISVNPLDTKVRGKTSEPQNPPLVLGWDAAGEVISIGEESKLFKPGDKVFYAGSIDRPGSNSQYQLVDERIVGSMPTTLSFEEAAAIPLTTITAWEALFHRLQIPLSPKNQPPKNILILGGAGGVGSIAIQLANKIAGLQVVATASRPETEKWCRDLGAHQVINHHENIPSQLRKTDFENVDYALIFNDTDKNFPPAAETIAPQGKICTIVENQFPLDMGLLKAKSASFHWEFMFTRPVFKTADIIEQHHLLNHVARLIDDGIIKTTVKEVLEPINIKNLIKAHTTLESGSSIGKIVLKGWL